MITREEVLQHNSQKDCWIIIQNNVYDISSFISSHPGGSDILMSRAGEDATSYFGAKHGNNPKILKLLEKYKIGSLAVNQQIDAASLNEPFMQDMIDKCYKARLFNISPDTAKNYFILRLISVLAFFSLSFIALYSNLNIFICILLVIFQAIISNSLFGFIAHETTHRQYPGNKILRFLLRISWPVFWPFISQKPLHYEHNSHHIKIGDPEYDFEVAAFSKFIRYSGTVKYSPLNKYQHKLAAILYPFYANIITTFGGATSYFWASHNRKVALEHFLSLLNTFIFYILIPYLITGSLYKFILLYLVYQCVLFYGIYVSAAINHFIPQATQKIPEDLKNTFSAYVCYNTSNFCINSRFWFWYTGGFNVQIEHHLIPFIPVENLRKLIPIVKELCLKYNYPYKEYMTFKDLWNDHYAYLEMLSKDVKNPEIANEILNKEGYQAR